MISTPKVIGLMSCGFLLCLGLSNVAQAENAAPAVEGEAGTPHTRQPGGPRLGGQAGQPDPAPDNEELKKAMPSHQRQKGGPRAGGQAAAQPELTPADKAAEKAQPSHQRQKDGPRVGGQGAQ